MTLIVRTSHGTFSVVGYPDHAKSILTFHPVPGIDGDTVVPSGARYRVGVRLSLQNGAYRACPGEEFDYIQRLQSNDVWVFRQKWRSRVTLEWLVANVVAEAIEWAGSHHSEVAAVIQSGVRSTHATARNYDTVAREAEAGPGDEAHVRRAATFRARHAVQESLLREYASYLCSSRP